MSKTTSNTVIVNAEQVNSTYMTTTMIDAVSMTAETIMADTVTTDDLVATDLTTENVDTTTLNSVTVNNSGTINTEDLGATQVTTDDLDSTTITTGELGATAVVTATLGATTITTGTLNSSTVTNSGALTSNIITGTTTVGAGNLLANTSTIGTLTATGITATGINTGTLGATGITTETIGATSQATFEQGIRTAIGADIYKYSTGTWSPTYININLAGFNTPDGTTAYDYQYGYYIKQGSLVNAYFDFKFSRNRASPDHRLAGIGNLPFKIYKAITSGDIQSTCALSSVSFPNGFVGSLPAFIGVPVFTGPYTATAYEQGYPISMYSSTLPANGYSLIIRCIASSVIGSVEIPFFNTIATYQDYLSEEWCNVATLYPDCRFAGTISYFTDD